ncbi:nuclear transport factor 2 family protein [Actomonas aquatica]|uniref:Nuclear transport factor 2 family protein n=1 Tax=Actomonas aquatica TaxID=2866162 RepID=A0ABZ1CAZ8_9BACT|nr:nuclear transport factor 2 family protein [Opitutus sp. WL0086]WRQ88872.1 nuclear transport factor 2 family protein [Opitutus sp. WL0086]
MWSFLKLNSLRSGVARGGLLALLLLGAVSGAHAATERAEAKALIEGFLMSWESGDAETFAAALHPDLEFAYPGGRLNRDEVIALFDSYQEEKTAIKIYFADYFITNGETHVTAYQFAATDRETEQRFAVGTGVLCKIADGKIVLFKEYWDTEVAPRQKAGQLPLDEGVVTPWPASVWLRPDTID